MGHTENYLEIAVKTNEKYENEIIKVKLVDIQNMKLIGDVTEM